MVKSLNHHVFLLEFEFDLVIPDAGVSGEDEEEYDEVIKFTSEF